jgi:peptidoglycan/LPS O-acetylase OafA/YrhL
VDRAPRTSLQYLPGLDGIRALAVVAVVLFHSSLGVLSGGFLGVEIFFVISGFIITAGLVREFSAGRSIGLRDFWLRRALRLLPAVLLLLFAVLAYTELFARDSLGNLRNDATASALYVTNWYLIADGRSYFGGFEEPSLLKHLWSLAIEEQFYMVWPPVILAGLMVMRRRVLAAWLLLAALASAGLMAAMHAGGADVSRLYYGTDTRASGLLIGAALALWWAPGTHEAGPRTRWLLNALGAGALVALSAFCVGLSDSNPALYRGGFLAVDVATAVLLVAAVSPGTLIARSLGTATLRWIGLRSYGLYLWHWPIILIITPELRWAGGTYVVFGLQLAATTIVAAASYRWVEAPIRRAGFRGTLDALRRRVQLPLALRLARATGAAAAVCSVAVVVGFAATAQGPKEPEYFKLDSIRVVSAPRATATPNAQVSGVVSVGDVGTPQAAPHPQPVAMAALTDAFAGRLAVADSPEPNTGVPPAAATGDPSPLPTPGPILDLRVTAVGDSVMLGAAQQLAGSIAGIDVDAMVSRSMDNAIGVLK